MSDFSSRGSEPPPAPMKTNLRQDFAAPARFEVLDPYVPPVVAVAPQVAHLLVEVHVHPGGGFEVVEHAAGERAEVDVGADVHARGGHRLAGVAALHHQRNPLGDLVGVFAVLHAGKQGRLPEGLVAFAEVVYVVFTPHKAHVRNAPDEAGRRANEVLPDEVGPELPRHLEGLGDFGRLRRIDRAVRHFGRIVEFAEGRVAGAGVVPGVGAFGRGHVEPFNDFDGQVGLQFFKQYTEGSTHDPGADQHYVGMGLGGIHAW